MTAPNIELSNNAQAVTGGDFGVNIDGINGPVTVNGDLTITGGTVFAPISGNVNGTVGAVTPAAGTFTALHATVSNVLPTYTLGTLPTVLAGGLIFVSDAATGAGRIAYGNTAHNAWVDPQTGIAVA